MIYAFQKKGKFAGGIILKTPCRRVKNCQHSTWGNALPFPLCLCV
ncbi:hypothetical protein HMPREF1051_2284 [Neisseria sicca VK64]|uniref:Uncharacterized protein n=1 Tax=Neisseria sicca VK64 TaxID=1095748 RepID=I2NKV1_NEISI|nr:hypothetical protein HMPREF1051_2284 [Neisseria sicca VK64]